MTTPSQLPSRQISSIPPSPPKIESFWDKFKAFLSFIVSYIPLIGSYLTQAQKGQLPTERPLTSDRVKTKGTESDEKVGSVAAVIKPTITREMIVAKLAEATGFEKNLFDDLTDTQIEKLKPVYQELADAKKTSADIRTSMSGERLTFAKFSRRVFTALPFSLSFYIDPDIGKLQLFADRLEVIGKGTYKKAKLAKGEMKDYVRGTFLPEITPLEREGILITQLKAYNALREKVASDQLKYLCLPEVVTYQSAKTKTTKKILLAPYMNLRDVHQVGYKIPANQGVSVMLQIAKGVKALHDAGYAHLDVRGPNILLHLEEDGTYTAKLTDFDLIADTAKGGTHQRYEDVLTIFTWEAPELDISYPSLSNSLLKRCDIFSLGKVFEQFKKAGSVPVGQLIQFRELVASMININPAKRPIIEQVITSLEAMR